MTFRPRMTAFTEGIRATDALRWRAWDGVVADLWCAEGVVGGGGHYVSPDPRIVIFLDEGASAVRLSDKAAGGGVLTSGRVSFVPAGMPLWSRIVESRRFQHLDLHFDGAALLRRLAGRFHPTAAEQALARPVMADDSGPILDIARLLAGEVASPSQHDLFAEGLILAILGGVLPLGEARGNTGAVRGGLSGWQMRRITDFMQANLHRRVSVAELAAQIGLSESWFARAFKQGRGETPHNWQQSLRIDAAKALLGGQDHGLAEIAAATGFADQAHMTRAFRGVTGTTPAAWRRAHAAG
ncbi:AraC family transcriptional regulator [Neogemmobacter tilapiae]|nr:AraC family transcriptional regulator [Gemmobacter tilapiae]